MLCVSVPPREIALSSVFLGDLDVFEEPNGSKQKIGLKLYQESV